NANVNQNTNVNRNVNVNQNVNVNRNVNVNSGYYGGNTVVVHDNDWNWGAFAAGTAVAATAAVATSAAVAASHPAPVVVAPGAVVTALPPGCAVVAGASATIYGCGGVYYRPYYQGSSLVYQVVTYP